MYDYIKGTVTNIKPTGITLDNSGIGYYIHTPNPYVFHIKETTTVYIFFHVREDAQILYGFATTEQRDLFTRLLQVTGIGPKSALSILAACTPKQLIYAIEEEDEALLVKFPGVGKKTARQMILDLKGKVSDLAVTGTHNLFTIEDEENESTHKKSLNDALLALQSLGYHEREIKKIQPHLETTEGTTDELIKKALSLMVLGKR